MSKLDGKARLVGSRSPRPRRYAFSGSVNERMKKAILPALGMVDPFVYTSSAAVRNVFGCFGWAPSPARQSVGSVKEWTRTLVDLLENAPDNRTVVVFTERIKFLQRLLPVLMASAEYRDFTRRNPDRGAIATLTGQDGDAAKRLVLAGVQEGRYCMLITTETCATGINMAANTSARICSARNVNSVLQAMNRADRGSASAGTATSVSGGDGGVAAGSGVLVAFTDESDRDNVMHEAMVAVDVAERELGALHGDAAQPARVAATNKLAAARAALASASDLYGMARYNGCYRSRMCLYYNPDTVALPCVHDTPATVTLANAGSESIQVGGHEHLLAVVDRVDALTSDKDARGLRLIESATVPPGGTVSCMVERIESVDIPCTYCAHAPTAQKRTVSVAASGAEQLTVLTMLESIAGGKPTTRQVVVAGLLKCGNFMTDAAGKPVAQTRPVVRRATSELIHAGLLTEVVVQPDAGGDGKRRRLSGSGGKGQPAHARKKQGQVLLSFPGNRFLDKSAGIAVVRAGSVPTMSFEKFPHNFFKTKVSA